MKTLYSDILYNSKTLYNVNCICTNVDLSLKLKCEFNTTEFSLTSNYLGTNSVVVKRVDCISCAPVLALFIFYEVHKCTISCYMTHLYVEVYIFKTNCATT